MGPDKLTLEDAAAMAAGALAFLNLLLQVSPDSSTEDLLDQAKDVAEGKTAARMFVQVVQLRKLKI